MSLSLGLALLCSVVCSLLATQGDSATNEQTLPVLDQVCLSEENTKHCKAEVV